jgi:hypothetical protein
MLDKLFEFESVLSYRFLILLFLWNSLRLVVYDETLFIHRVRVLRQYCFWGHFQSTSVLCLKKRRELQI